MKRPALDMRRVAACQPNERVVSFSHGTESGTIAIVVARDGSVYVDLYHCTPGVTVRVSPR